MKEITNKIQTYYRYDGKFYTISERKDFRMNDIFIDGRDYSVKMISSTQDYVDVAYMAPETYVILEEATM